MRDLTDVVPHERMMADHLLDGIVAALRAAAADAAAAEAAKSEGRRERR